MTSNTLLIFVIFISTEILCNVSGQNVFAQTTIAGNIKGKNQTVNGKSYGVYLGIPFAKPPVGDLRFKEPQPLDPASSTTIVDASNDFSKACIPAMRYSSNYHSEDCLYLNVLTPKIESADNVKYPVMVWIHGGAFIQGSAAEYPVEGTLRNLVSRGVVFVSLNYRLGAFGFLTTRSSIAPGNYGLLDQVEALRWVHNNIQFFGGDAGKVTIFGESAGGASVSLLTISPLTKGLFNQAITMSGSSLSPWTLTYDSDPRDLSANILESLGCRQKLSTKPANVSCPYKAIGPIVASAEDIKRHETELTCLRSKTVAEIASERAGTGMRPRIDGKFLPESPETLIKKRSPINLMIGADASETAFFEFVNFPGIPSLIAQSESDFYRSSISIDCNAFKYPDLINFMAQYHYAYTTTPTARNLDEKHFWFQQTIDIKSAPSFWVPAYREALEARNSNSTVYLYSWDFKDAMDFYDPKIDFYWKGAPHSSELFSLFDTNHMGYLVRDGNHTRRDKSQDVKSTEVFGKLFTNFAKFGNPTPLDNALDGVIWTPISNNSTNYLSIDMPQVRMLDGFYAADVGVWTQFLPTLEDLVKCEDTILH